MNLGSIASSIRGGGGGRGCLIFKVKVTFGDMQGANCL